MTYNPNVDSGFCKTKSWVQVPSAVFTAIDQSTEYDDAQGSLRTARNYAQMVYQVNATPISGTISVDSVGIDDSGIVQLSGDQLKVFDGQVLTELEQVNTKLDNLSAFVVNDFGSVQLSGDMLKVFDGQVLTQVEQVNTKLDSILVSDTYSRIVEVLGTDTYIAHAQIGSLSTDSVWRVQKLDTNGSRMWANSGLFTSSAASPMSALTFSY